LAQLRLPSAGELALAFDHLGAPQEAQWSTTEYSDDNGSTINYFGTRIAENASRTISFSTVPTDAIMPFRWVTSATN
jgi:hypothetical protein